jgi:hypothetical protein
MKRATILSMVLVLVLSAAGIALAASDNSVPGQLAAIQAVLQQILRAVTPGQTTPPTTTRLLFPFAANSNGFDTGLSIANTGLDSTGNLGKAGTCTFRFFSGGSMVGTYTSPMISPGASFATLVSVIQPGFQGYVEVDCDFPLAHGWGFLSDVTATKLAATIPALVLPENRTAQNEALGQ